VKKIGPEVFNPPPKVDSGVLRLRRKENYNLLCSEKLFVSVVKSAFNQRRKTLRNGLKSFGLPKEETEKELFQKRPEQLSVQTFIDLTVMVEKYNRALWLLNLRKNLQTKLKS